MVFQWREGSRVKLDPQVAGQELERIRTRDGKIETVTVVDEARPEDAPLHPAFEWDDSVAGEKYRLYQARNLVRSIEVAPEKEGKDTLPAFVHIRATTTQEPGYYQSVTVAARNPDEWASALNELSGKANAALKAVEILQRLAEGKTPKIRKLVKKAGVALNDAKTAIAEIAG